MHKIADSVDAVRVGRCALRCVALMIAAVVSAQQSDSVEGIWVNGDGDGWIELRVSGDELQGRIIGSPDDPGDLQTSRLDVENPDEALRTRELRGALILSGFKSDGDGRWSGGKVYDPNSGNTYKGTITVVDATTLRLRGYILFSLFGRTEVWRRRVE